MASYGFIGIGNMCSAILNGILKTGSIAASQLKLYDVDRAKAACFAKHGAKVCDTPADACAGSDFLFLCVKPQVMPQVLPELAPHCSESTVIVSIAAGITADAIRSAIPQARKIVLVMPNTPLMLGCGAVAFSVSDAVDAKEAAQVEQIFSAGGIAKQIPADKMNEIIPVNGSSPAFLYELTRYICDCAADRGIDPETAKELFCQTMIGSARMMMESGMTLEELIRMVSSPGGTTLKGLDAMRTMDSRSIVEQVFADCIQRAYELGEQK